MLTCFGMIWKYDKLSRRNIKFGKIYAFSKIHISSNLIVKRKRHIRATANIIYKKFQNVSFENYSLKTHILWEKKTL
jgi:hypothetical protein